MRLSSGVQATHGHTPDGRIIPVSLARAILTAAYDGLFQGLRRIPFERNTKPGVG